MRYVLLAIVLCRSASAADPIVVLRAFSNSTSYAFSRDHSHMLRWRYRGKFVELWNLKANKQIRSWKTEEGILQATVSADGKRFVTRGTIRVGEQTTHRVRVWRADKAEPVRTFVTKMRPAFVSNDAKRLLCVECFGADVAPFITEVKLFDISGRQPRLLHRMDISDSDPTDISEVRFSKSSATFFSQCGLSDRRSLWDVANKDPIVTFGREFLAREPATQRFLLWKKGQGRGDLQLWRKAKLAKKIRCDETQTLGTFHPKKNQILTGQGGSGELTLRDAATGKTVQRYAGGADVRAIRFHPDGTRFVTRTGSPYAPRRVGLIQLWDTGKRKPLRTYQHRSAVKEARFVPGRKQVLAWTTSEIVLFGPDRDEPLQVIQINDDPLCLHFIGSDRFIVVPVSGPPKLFGLRKQKPIR